VSAVALECISQITVDIAFSCVVESGFHIDPMICYKKAEAVQRSATKCEIAPAYSIAQILSSTLARAFF